MKFSRFSICLLLLVITGFISCKKESQQLNTPPISDFYPLEVGHVYYYQMDSTVLVNFGARFENRSYHLKDSIESTLMDDQGHLSYRIFRFITDTAESQPWKYYGTTTATIANNQLEYVEDNLRYIRLHEPIRNGFTWKGNSYIDTRTEQSAVKYLDDWDYEYGDFGQSFTDTATGRTFENTVTVFQANELSPGDVEDPTLPFQQKKYAYEVYAKGIGLVYKNILQWTWQSTHFEDNGFGLKLVLIKHQ